jgi:hypothetical protein
MILPSLNVPFRSTGNFFYFAADSKYFDLYGKALALSLIQHAPWANVHVHLYNATDKQLEWCSQKNVSYTNELIDVDDKEFNTLCACIRFIRIPEIFDPAAKIISFDCDVIANKTIPLTKFLEATVISKITIRKGGKSLASAISFGNDDFRNIYSTRLYESFKQGNIYWFLDQDILDTMMMEKSIPQLSSEWTGTKMTPDRMIWTAKGSRKHENEQYVNLLNFYNSQV